ncbi:MAG: D-glycero-beta-D-manno-heptose 1-phosphate adenylyltransferase [Deltaproteobacteria bacterium]|nr:D-glycero-beta-D-manno-heptose 1-phosphate adenylyltransferase [Deltaproteobacteria bacterium]
MEQFRGLGTSVVHLLLANMLGKNLVVIGDAILDHYLMGSVNRISPEAPVPVIDFSSEHFSLGGAANVAQCAAGLGAQVNLISIVGDDVEGHTLMSMAKDLGIMIDGVLVDHCRPTPCKTRIIASNQHVARVDREHGGPISEFLQQRIASAIEHVAEVADAFILTDYAKGVLSPAVCRAAIRAARGKPVIVDPKGSNWERYRRATVIKPNIKEAEAISGAAIHDNEDAARFGRRVCRDLEVSHIMVTMGAQGAVLVSDGASPYNGSELHFPSHTREVFDVTGAGDTVAAALGASLAGGATIAEAAWLANSAAGVCVSRLGAAPVSQRDIISALDEQPIHSGNKVISRPEAARLAAKLRAQSKKLAFTNGCFDLLHVGHVTLLEESRRAGDALFVGVNTDDSVRRLKGPNRPIQQESDRARIVAAQGCVDAVVLFDEDTPYQLIRLIRPDVLTKGADYSRKEDVVGWDIVEGYGGSVRLLELVEGRSSTGLIRRAGMTSVGLRSAL